MKDRGCSPIQNTKILLYAVYHIHARFNILLIIVWKIKKCKVYYANIKLKKAGMAILLSK